MRAHTGAVLAAVLLAAGAPQAFAAAKAACLQVTDASGDGTSANGAVPSRAALDILSGDLATGRRNLVVVLRLASVEADPTLATGVTYSFGWTTGGAEPAVRLVRYTNGDEVATFDPDTAGTASGDERAVTAVVDPGTSSITWTVPRSAVPALRRGGARFGAMKAFAEPVFNVATPQGTPFDFSGSVAVLGGDSASSGRTYTDRAPSCVKAL